MVLRNPREGKINSQNRSTRKNRRGVIPKASAFERTEGSPSHCSRRRPRHRCRERTRQNNRHRGSGRPLAPATPPYMRVRIRRFDKLVPPMDWQAECSRFGDAVRVSLLGSASIAASPRRAHQRPAKAGWRVHYPHRDPSTTGPSYGSGLPHLCEYYALC